MIETQFWRGRRVLLTGHTGFKGSWLSLWLRKLGAQVVGYALPPPTDPSLFQIARVGEGMVSIIADVRDLDQLVAAIDEYRPEVVFHLAAQALVRSSYHQPVGTYATNIMGTVHLLEAVRLAGCVRAVLNITSDKCYENRERFEGYREHEPMGGFDPYSSSKGCAELVTAAYRQSYLEKAEVAVATARAGNVIGGGDWAVDRLIPDVLRAIDAGKILFVRRPDAVRPWQHVLEPLAGYLVLAKRLFEDGQTVAEAWNFGPADDDARSVRWIVEQLVGAMPGVVWKTDESSQPREANLLKLDSSKARARLAWSPRWRVETALKKTLEWHVAWREGRDMQAVTLSQIADYQQSTKLKNQALRNE